MRRVKLKLEEFWQVDLDFPQFLISQDTNFLLCSLRRERRFEMGAKTLRYNIRRDIIKCRALCFWGFRKTVA